VADILSIITEEDEPVVNKKYDPLVAPAPPEVPLPNAPLVRVISQVRFPIILSIEKKEFIAAFQEAIRDEYPVLRGEHTGAVIIGPQTTEPTERQMTWRFSDIDGKWRASLAPSFVALETTGYTSRSDFVERLRFVLQSLSTHVGPKIVDRLGIRYIDRVTGDQVHAIEGLVRKEILGILATPAVAHAQHALCETLFAVPHGNAKMMVRWGRLPTGITPDPQAIEPVSDPSWILDIDMFRSGPSPFDLNRLIDDTRAFSERIYAFFRWAVTDNFLREYGGRI
jgi:uncharacterized protein (TIGR04255 family)